MNGRRLNFDLKQLRFLKCVQRMLQSSRERRKEAGGAGCEQFRLRTSIVGS